MNSFERVCSALLGKKPDRLPIMETLIDWKVIQGLGFSNYFEMIDGLDIDAVSVTQHMYDPSNVVWHDEKNKIIMDNWGVPLRFTSEIVPMAVKHPLSEGRDIDTLSIPDPADDPLLTSIPPIVNRYKGQRCIMMLGRAVFTGSFLLRGMDNILMDYAINPDFALKLGKLLTEYNMELHRLAIKAGVDLIILGDDYAHKSSTIMSPAHFKEFILPGLTKVVANIKGEGAFCIKHSDGNIWGILDDIVATGVDGVGPLEPNAGMDLKEIRKKLDTKLCLMGNLDVDLLSRGSQEEVRENTKTLIENVSPEGGHILSSGNSIPSAVNPENFKAMIDTAREFGSYPIVCR